MELIQLEDSCSLAKKENVLFALGDTEKKPLPE